MKLAAPSLVLALLCLPAAARAEPIQPDAIGIVDGDTITVRGLSRHVRLLGYDTPETGFEARCVKEWVLANKATQRLRQIVAEGGLDLTIVPCKCPPETAGTMACNLGRYCGWLRSKGREVATLMMSEGLARPGPRKRLPHQYSWCD